MCTDLFVYDIRKLETTKLKTLDLIVYLDFSKSISKIMFKKFNFLLKLNTYTSSKVFFNTDLSYLLKKKYFVCYHCKSNKTLKTKNWLYSFLN